MNSFQIKIVAILCMVIDHVGLFFFPQFILLRLIGRLAFPLFAWLIASGARHTRDTRRYLARLVLLACATQIPFWYANQLIGSDSWYFNVVFTLCLGLAAIMAIQRFSSTSIRVAAVIACAGIAICFNTDYGAAGVLSIVAFYCYAHDFRKLVMSQALITGVLPLLIAELAASTSIDLSRIYLSSTIECVGLLSLVVIRWYNHERGRRDKYLFYVFYFVQYVLILGLKIAAG